MPIYEYYCEDCHTVFSFFSRRINTEAQPACPRCEQPDLRRKASVFAISKGRSESDDGGMPDIDESKMEQVLASMAGDLDNIDENDPKAAAGMMRKLFDATGLQMGEGMREALRRMDSGEDPDQIEADLGDVLETEDPFATGGKVSAKALRNQHLPPRVDETLYELE